MLSCFINAINNAAINISRHIGAWLSSQKLRRASDGRARRFMIPFIEVQWWSIRSQRFAVQFELHGGQKITHLTYPPIHLSPFFSTLMLVTRHTLVSRMDYDPPTWHALFVTRRQCKNPRSSRIFFPDGISSSKLDLWTRTSPPSDHKALDVPVIQQWKRFNVINDDDRKPLMFSSLPIYIGRNKCFVEKTKIFKNNLFILYLCFISLLKHPINFI